VRGGTHRGREQQGGNQGESGFGVHGGGILDAGNALSCE
jgi:hypothetical protein